MASPVFIPSSPNFEVLHFKQRQGENLKDAWFRMLESYRSCALEGDFKILIRNFYIGLTLPHKQLLDVAAEGEFIEIDPSSAYEILEGIVGILPRQERSSLSLEGTQILEKLLELQKLVEPFKNIVASINRMNNLIKLYNKRLDALDLRISEYEGKSKEPPGLEHNPIKKTSAKDGTS